MLISKKKAKKTYASQQSQKKETRAHEGIVESNTEQEARSKKKEVFNSKSYIEALKKQHWRGTIGSLKESSLLGVLGGLATTLSGLAKTTCKGIFIPSNPLIIGIGVVVTLVSIGYLVWSYFQ